MALHGAFKVILDRKKLFCPERIELWDSLAVREVVAATRAAFSVTTDRHNLLRLWIITKLVLKSEEPAELF